MRARFPVDPRAVQWLLGDDQGTIHDVVDGSGAVIDHVVVDAFGVVVSQTNVAVSASIPANSTWLPTASLRRAASWKNATHDASRSCLIR